MELHAVDLSLLELRLVSDLPTGIGTHARRPIVLVRVETDVAVGIGECDALSEPTYTSEYARGAFFVLADHLVPRLLAGGAVGSVEEGLERLAGARGHEMARAGLEMALLDAELRASGCSLARRLGATRDRVGAGATIGLGPPEEILVSIDAARAEGYRQVKLKIVPGTAATTLAAVREAAPDLVVCADANGTFDLSRDRVELERIAGLGLTSLEQPLPADDLAGSAHLCALGLPVVLDESVTTMGDLERSVEARASVGIAIKPARVGGLLAAMAMAERARALGLSCGVGGMLETGIARAASLCLAARPEFELPCDLGASARYFDPDLTEPHELVDGALIVPDGPGLGVRLDESLVEATTRERRRIVPR